MYKNYKLPKSLKQKKIEISRLAHISAIYGLWKNGKLMYIGESSNVYSRILQHVKKEQIDFTHFTIMRIESERKRKKFEAILIQRHRPICNYEHNPDVTLKKRYV